MPIIPLIIFGVLATLYVKANGNNDILAHLTLMDIILFKILLAIIWFDIGLILHIKVLPSVRYPNIKKNIDQLSLTKLSLIIFISIFTLKLLLIMVTDLFLFNDSFNIEILNMSNNGNNTGGTTNNNGNNASVVEAAANATIITGCITAAAKAANSCPTVLGKMGTIAGGSLIGVVAYATLGFKNYVSNYTKNLGNSSEGCNKFLDESISQILNSTGNDAIDLLNLIHLTQKVQLLFIFLICYNLILLNYVGEAYNNKLESFLLKYFHVKLVNYFLKAIIALQKAGKFNIICLFILLIISNIQCNYYLGFFIDNIDNFIKLYFTS